MKTNYSISYSSSSKSSYLSHEPKGLKHGYPSRSQTLLHSVKKSQAKPWKNKAPIAPMPPTPVKIYKVDPMNFRDLVQQLTGAPEFKPQLLQSIARVATSLDVPSPPEQNLPISRVDTAAACTNWFHEFQSEAFGMTTQEISDEAMTPGFLEMNLSSPSYSNWCSFLLMSPRTVTSLEPGKVL
ncbi:uncharacterized protein LOC133303190 [Gastrolobium bilobum]|uniref:uncharacterized protein LOC133303190 n=1 Tax=Gastrolobium bilobum TaxID=150636 RepID=UPI002AB220B4|nr:uncharacterized protein LOC133303190 [Gastrolobium bilobum]